MVIVSEIAISRCFTDPEVAGDLCGPDTTVEEDAIKGKWVLVPRNLNTEGGYLSLWLVRHAIHSLHILGLTPYRTFITAALGGRIQISLSISKFYPQASRYQKSRDGIAYRPRSMKASGDCRLYIFGTRPESKQER